MKVSVIIVHWNTPNELNKQISLLKPTKELEVIIIDNASEKSIKNLELRNKNLRVVENNTNQGFAKACNQGATISKGEWLLFLNPDTFLTSEEILKFTKNAEKKSLDAASPEQKGDSYYKPVPTWLSLLAEFSPLRRIIPLSSFKKHTLFGGCLLMRASVLKEIGGWDEDFFLWFEDSDLTNRLYRNGFKVGWLPATYSHKGGVSFSQLDTTYKKRLFFSSMNLYAQKHFDIFGQLIIKAVSWWNLK